MKDSKIEHLTGSGWVNFDSGLAMHYLEYGLAHGRLDIWDSGSLSRLEYDESNGESIINLRHTINDNYYIYRFRVKPEASGQLNIRYARIMLPAEHTSITDESFYVAVLDSDENAYSDLFDVKAFKTREQIIHAAHQFPDPTELNNYFAFISGRFINDAAHLLLSWDSAQTILPVLSARYSLGTFGTYLGPHHDYNLRNVFMVDDAHIYELSLAEDAVKEFEKAWQMGDESELIIPYQCLPRDSFSTVTATLYSAQRDDETVEFWEERRELQLCDSGVSQIWSGEKIPHESFLGPVFPAADSLDMSLDTIFSYLKNSSLEMCNCHTSESSSLTP